MTEPAHPVPQPREISGRWVVIGVFAFALLMTGGLWGYWKLHVAPFLPLQQALAGRFEGSRPRVEGGQRKMSEGTPRILRVTMQVEFAEPEFERQTAEFAETVAGFVREHQDLSKYEILELHFYRLEPEKTIRQTTIEFPLE